MENKQEVLEKIYAHFMEEVLVFHMTDIQELKIGNAFSIITYLQCYDMICNDANDSMFLDMVEKFKAIDEYMIVTSEAVDARDSVKH